MIPRPIKAKHFEKKGRIISVEVDPISPKAVFVAEDGQIDCDFLSNFTVTDPGYLRSSRQRSVLSEYQRGYLAGRKENEEIIEIKNRVMQAGPVLCPCGQLFDQVGAWYEHAHGPEHPVQ